MKQSKRLQPICDFKKRQEDEAARDLAQTSENVNLQKQRLIDLQSYQLDYDEQFRNSGGGGMSATRMREYQQFMANLKEVVEKQKAAILILEKEFEEKRRQWLAIRNNTKAISNMQSRYETQEAIEDEKKLQKEQDDRNQRIRN